MGWVIFGSFFLLLLIGVPIGLAIGLSALIVFLAGGLPLQMVPQTLLEGNNSFALVAVPFFILAGDLLARGGISERIVAFSEACLGRVRSRPCSSPPSPAPVPPPRPPWAPRCCRRWRRSATTWTSRPR